MQMFSGFEYLQISLANCFGLDKLNWQDRIYWSVATMNQHDVEEIAEEATEPMMFRKTWKAIEDAKAGLPIKCMVPMDATASGLQILACLIGCHDTARNVNLIDTGKREDVYNKVAEVMRSHDADVSRDDIKRPLMTVFYGSKQQPKMLFGEGSLELAAFYTTLEEELGGALECMDDIQSCWQEDALVHQWTLPDGHTAYVPVMVEKVSKIEVDDLDHTTFTHHHYVNTPDEFGISLAANVVHSIDGYVVREMVRRAHAQGFQLATIHDSFWAHPNYMNLVRSNYKNILAEIANSNLLANILSQICGEKVEVVKRSDNLAEYILYSEYALS